MDFAPYDCINVHTQQAMYMTHASPEEIQQANANLRNAENAFRYYPHGTFASPSLHG